MTRPAPSVRQTAPDSVESLSRIRQATVPYTRIQLDARDTAVIRRHGIIDL